MKVNVNCKSIVSIDIEAEEAFRILVKTLDMNCILDEVNKYYTRKNDDGDLCVYEMLDGHDELYDERGELYEALLATAKCIFPM